MRVDVLHKRLVWRRPEQVGDLLAGRDAIERIEEKLLHAGQSTDVAQPPLQRIAIAHLGAAHRGDNRQPAVDGTGQNIGQHVQGALVGPVQVVDDEDDGTSFAEFLQPGIEGDRKRCRRIPGCDEPGERATLGRRQAPYRRSDPEEWHCHRRQWQTRAGQDQLRSRDQLAGVPTRRSSRPPRRRTPASHRTHRLRHAREAWRSYPTLRHVQQVPGPATPRAAVHRSSVPPIPPGGAAGVRISCGMGVMGARWPMIRYAIGSNHRRPSNRANPASWDASRSPCEIASAARCTSGHRSRQSCRRGRARP